MPMHLLNCTMKISLIIRRRDKEITQSYTVARRMKLLRTVVWAWFAHEVLAADFAEVADEKELQDFWHRFVQYDASLSLPPTNPPTPFPTSSPVSITTDKPATPRK
jgi:hypothetical protein